MPAASQGRYWSSAAMTRFVRLALRIRPAVGMMALLACSAGRAAEPCRIEVVEQGSGWPVPLVELRTTHHVRLVTDNAGLIAFDLPELMGRETWLGIQGHGYGVPKDGFGYRGVRVTPRPGGTLRLEIDRTIVARRLGRITGSGLFAESQKLGQEPRWRDGPVMGCDSVQVAEHRGRLFWLWGDTTLARYPLGIFHATCATTPLRPLDSLKPPVRLEYEYFTDQHRTPRGVARMPGSGPTWLSGLVSLPDQSGRARLVAVYNKIKPPLEAYECGLCVWSEEKEAFERHRVVWTKSENTPKPPPLPQGHAVAHRDEDGRSWLLFGDPFPRLRCPATFEAWQDPSRWKTLTPPETVPAAGGDDTIQPHSGSIAFSPWRKRWVTVFMQRLGKPSAFGELWYAEADSPTGPWGPAVKVLSHENYTFYNPRLHPELTPPDSPVLLLEGTYTAMFADRPEPTPRYDYNQVLYRLDLDDAALAPAQR